MRRAALALFFILCFVVPTTAQGGFGVAYYDVDKLYDTIPSKFYDDGDYTPEGRRRWSGERYAAKVRNIARVVDSLSMPVVVLYGVENEQVVRDVVAAAGEDYAYVHRTQDYNDGLDFALLYFADIFFVERVTPWRGAMCVEGEVNGRELTVVATNRSSSLRVLFEERDLHREGNNIVVVGQPSRAGFANLGVEDCLLKAERAGRGNIFTSGYWVMRDRAASNIAGSKQCDVYIKSWLLNSNGVPQPTFDGVRFCGGYSSALPIYIYFEEIFAF